MYYIKCIHVHVGVCTCNSCTVFLECMRFVLWGKLWARGFANYQEHTVYWTTPFTPSLFIFSQLHIPLFVTSPVACPATYIPHDPWATGWVVCTGDNIAAACYTLWPPSSSSGMHTCSCYIMPLTLVYLDICWIAVNHISLFLLSSIYNRNVVWVSSKEVGQYLVAITWPMHTTP